MGYIIIGVLGFLVAHLFDVVSLKRIPGAKQGVGIVVAALIGYATLMVCLDSERLALPIWVTWLGWALLSVSVPLLVYSLFVNLPFRKTYVAPGVGDRLVRTGTYALVRHPGVFWYALLLVSLILISKSKLLLVASPIWLGMDILHVVIQDKFLFGKMFKDYEDYRRETPMLIPNRRSISACLRTIRQPGTESELQEGRG
jgi:protein-S-isoprenylcysteine O-methyltransferase Ste14